MRLSISNIAWSETEDTVVYQLMRKYGYTGLEIAPTRIFPEYPYDRCEEAGVWSYKLKRDYGIVVSSMQSIWFGKQEKLFGTFDEQKELLEYTKKAIDFASVIGCKNLVFGCPKNRNMPDNADTEVAIAFFRQIGDYAAAHGTVIGMEANPTIYHTNYINDTLSALELIRTVNSKGFLLNLDVGTMIHNNEDVSELTGNIGMINHVHISEPGLNKIENRELHLELKAVLMQEKYDGYISIEMGKTTDISIIEDRLRYVGRVFKNG